jgi:hypothetical protein
MGKSTRREEQPKNAFERIMAEKQAQAELLKKKADRAHSGRNKGAMGYSTGGGDLITHMNRPTSMIDEFNKKLLSGEEGGEVKRKKGEI